jgi:hypothetical protein
MDRRKLIHAIFLFALPVIVASYGISTFGAILLVVLALLWRWAISVAGIIAPPRVPELELETIGISHFAEKARWCMDKLGIEYTEKHSGGIIGVLFTGRSVPRLLIRTGIVRSSIGNSPEILRYLWGRYAVEQGAGASFLEPTEERLAMEQRIDRYGVNLQVWVYYHILADKDLALSAWGVGDPRVPAWQRVLLPLIFPLSRAFLKRAFRLSETHYKSASGHIENLLGDVEAMLDDGRRSILGGNEVDFVDITFAALSTIWVRPENFARGEASRLLSGDTRFPTQMAVDIERWSDQFPLARAFVERLYREERVSD